jgi:hypothetical protein
MLIVTIRVNKFHPLSRGYYYHTAYHLENPQTRFPVLHSSVQICFLYLAFELDDGSLNLRPISDELSLDTSSSSSEEFESSS